MLGGHECQMVGDRGDSMTHRNSKFCNSAGTEYDLRAVHNVKCVMLNAQSIRSKFDEFKCYLAVNTPDIVCVTETWVSESFNGDRLTDFEVQGYNMFSCCRESKQGGGILIYVNSMYSVLRVDDTLKVKQVESIWIDVKLGKDINDDVRFGVFYRPGNIMEIPQLEVDGMICEEIRRNFKTNCLIMGDFNLREYEEKTGDTMACKIYRNLLEEELFMNQFVGEPTRKGSILDLVFSDNLDLVKELKVGEGLGKSDHNMVSFFIPAKVKPKDNLANVPNFHKANFRMMRNELLQVNWHQRFLDLSASQAWNAFKAILYDIQSRCIPMKVKRSRRKLKPPWLTPDVRNAIRCKNAAFRAMKKGAFLESDMIHYKKSRNLLKKKVRASKRTKELDLARNCQGNSKQFFSFYKLNNTPRSVGPLKSNNNVVHSDSEMTELLSTQFHSVFTIENTDDIESLLPQMITDARVGDMGEIGCELVQKYIERLRSNKSEGPDEIYATVLKECKQELSIPLSIIFSRSLNEADIPTDWKKANIVPIFKKGDKSCVENYRPVSLTSLVCKLLESIIKDNVVCFLSDNDIIKESQHGFMKGRSCLTNLLKFLDEATETFDQGKQLDVSFLDFSKAFDTVPHKRLCLQLKCHGIDGKILSWIENWLSGRQQRVVLNGSKSKWKNVISGVPQGSVLGPLLFLIFVNSIETVVNSDVLKFADDLKMFRIIGDKNDHNEFQSDLDRLVKWSEKWQMKFNFKKCKVMHIGREHYNTSYTMGGQTLCNIDSEKDLGVMINKKLSSSEQVQEARKKALRMLGVINRNVSYKSADVLIKLYCAYVRPHLEYCVQSWSPMYEKDSLLLERVQKRATKMVNGMKDLHYEDRLRTLKLFSLKYRRLRGDLIEVFKFVNGQTTGYLKDMFDFNLEGRNRGHQYKLVIKRSRTKLRQSFFSRRVVGHWNSLPNRVISAASIQAFKHNLDKHFTELGIVYRYSWD